MKLKNLSSYFTFLLLFLGLACLTPLIAQSGISMDKIILSDGSQLRGTILAQDEQLILELEDGQEITIPMEEVESIEKSSPDKLYFKNGAFLETKGWYHRGGIAFGGGQGNARVGGNSVLIEITNGYKFSKDFSLGIGVGLNLHTFQNTGIGEFFTQYTNDQYSMAPVFLEARFTPWLKRIAPFFSLNGGYGFGVDMFNYWADGNGVIKGGLTGGASAGIQIATRKKMGFLFHLTYKMQEAYSERDDNSGFFRVTDITFHRVLLGIGWTF